jgi:hypothetical protein
LKRVVRENSDEAPDIYRLEERRTQMKKAIILFVGLICIVLLGFSTRAARHGDSTPPPSGPTRTVVAREWKGRVAPARADEYYRYLFDGVQKIRSIPGSLGVQVMRRGCVANIALKQRGS